MTHMFRTFVSGLILLLPLIITLAVVAWLGQFIINYVGPSSIVGHALTTIGFSFSASQIVAYVIGLIVFLVVVYLLGLAVESRLRSHLSQFLNSTMRRIPVIGNLYDLIQRFVALMDNKDVDGLKSMKSGLVFLRRSRRCGDTCVAANPRADHGRRQGLPCRAYTLGAASGRRMSDLCAG